MRSTAVKRTIGIAAAAVAIAIVAGWFVLRSAAFHGFLLRKAQQEASAALGNNVRIGALALHVHGFTPSVDVSNVTIDGAAPFQDVPLLKLPRAHIEITIASLLHRRWFLSDLELDHPDVQILLDAQGRSNLPKGHAGAGGTSIWDLGIRHAVISSGHIRFQDKAVPLDADLDGVHFEARYSAAVRQYAGSFGYESGTLRLDSYEPIPHALAVQFAATPRGLEAPRIQLTSRPSRLDASLSLQDWSHPRISGHFQVTLDATQARGITHIAELPSGQMVASGGYQFAIPSGKRWLEGLSVSGSFSSGDLQVPAGSVHVPVGSLRGKFQLANDALSISPLQGNALDGSFSARFNWRELGAPGSAASFTAQLDRALLQNLVRFTGGSAATLGSLGVSGTVTAAISGGWVGNPKSAVVTSTTSIQADLGSTPIAGSAKLQFHPGSGALTILQSEFRTPHSTLSASGIAGRDANLHVSASTADLGEIEAIGDHMAAALGRRPPALELGGAGTLSADISGTLGQPQVAAAIALTDFAIRGSNWRSARASIHANSSALSLTDLTLLTGASGQITGSLRFGLQHWAPSSIGPLAAQISVTGLSLSPFESLVGRQFPAAGILHASINVNGTLTHPVGQGTVALAPGEFRVGGMVEPFQSMTLSFQGTEAELNAALAVQLAAGAVHVQGNIVPSSGSYDGTLTASGLQLDQLRSLSARKIPLQGVLALTGSGSGTLRQPAFHLTISSADLEVASQPIRNIQMQVDLAQQTVTVAATATTLGTGLKANARIGLSDGWPITASLDSTAIPLAPLLVAYAPGLAQQLQGQTAIHATASGRLRSLDQLQAQIELPSLHAAFTPNPAQSPANVVQLAATTPIHLNLARGVVTIAPAHLEGTETSLDLGGSVPLDGGGAMNLHLNGSVNVALAEAFVPGLSAGGDGQLALAVTGRLSSPVFGGTIALKNVSATPRGFPVGLQNGHGTLKFSSDRVDIESFEGSLGGGTLVATGGVALQPGARLDLAIAIRQARLRLPATVRETFSADLTFTGTPEAALLGGRVRVEEVSVTSDFDFAKFLAQVASGTTTVTAPGNFARNLSLNVNVSTPNQINTISRDFSLQANANLTVRGTADQPVVLGRVNLNSGDLIFRGDRFVIQSGTLDFANPARTNPVVDFTADTSIQQYDIHLHFQGQADNLKTTYTSDPALPPADIINLLAFGETTEASAANPAPGNLGAENLLASAVTSQITDRVQRIAGISQLSVDPVLGGGQQGAGARITIQQRVTGNLFITVSTDVSGTQRNVIEIQYKLSPRVSLSAVRDQNGGIGVSTKFKKIW